MGRVGFVGRTRRYPFLLVPGHSGVDVDDATPRRRPACVILTDFVGNCAIAFAIRPLATKMRVPLLRAQQASRLVDELMG